jgi:hypothetical protein
VVAVPVEQHNTTEKEIEGRQMIPLKQSTPSQSRMMYSMVDDTDFITAESGLTIANTDIKLSKNGAAAVNKNSGGATHIINGAYSVTFDATDTDTVGELYTSISVSGALVAEEKFWVYEEAIYAARFASGATGLLPANVTQVNSDADSAIRLALSTKQIIPGTVDTTAVGATNTAFESDDITEATNDHYNGRTIVFTSGVLLGQATSITDYTTNGANGVFTIVATTEAPGNNDTFIIV